MHRFKAKLTPGRKRPYTMWTFLIIPDELAAQWGPGSKAVRGTIANHPFSGRASRGEGVVRVPIPRTLRERAGIEAGREFDVAIELDAHPRLSIPRELRSVFKDEPEVAKLYAKLPPSFQRAWASYVAEAKQAETRTRRAEAAPKGIRARQYPR